MNSDRLQKTRDDAVAIFHKGVEAVAPDVPPRRPVVVSDRAGLPLTWPQRGLSVALPPRQPEAAPVAPMVVDGGRGPGEDQQPSILSEPRPAPEPAVVAETTTTARAARIAETETVLLEQVARAAAQSFARL